MFVVLNMLRCPNEHETDVMTAMVTRWELLAENACHLMLCRMLSVMDDSVDSRVLNLVPRFEFRHLKLSF
jgi:hypothetical protein